MADRLAGLLRHYSLSARVFLAPSVGSIITRRRMAISIWCGRGPITARSPVRRLLVTEPSLFYPRVASHLFCRRPGDTAELLCAEVDLGASTGSPLAMGLPSMLLIPLCGLARPRADA